MTHNSLLRSRKLILIFFAFILTAVSCTKMPPGGDDDKKTIFQRIASDGRFTILTAAVSKAGLASTLNSKKNSLTLFAPTDEAFRNAGLGDPKVLAEIDEQTLKNILLYHVLGSEVKSKDIPQASNTAVQTLANSNIFVTKTANSRVFVNGISVIQRDLDCVNGVIHVLGGVLSPATGTIVATAQGNPDLSFLVAAVLRASQGSTNVAAVLSSAGPFTVFAPTNKAFQDAGFNTIASIQAADPAVLTNILTYHVIAARVFSSDLVNNSTPTTVNGGTVKILLSSGAQVKGNSNVIPSNIIKTNILTTNGVVHVIDRVLLP